MGLNSLLDGIKTFPTYFIHGKRINHFNSLSRIQSAQHENMLFPKTFSGPHYSFLRLASNSYMLCTNSLYFPPLLSTTICFPLSFNAHLYFIAHRPSVPVSSVTFLWHMTTVRGAWGHCITLVKIVFLIWSSHLHTTGLLEVNQNHPRQSWGHSSTSVPMLSSHVIQTWTIFGLFKRVQWDSAIISEITI